MGEASETAGIALLGAGVFARDAYLPALQCVSQLRLEAVWSRRRESAEALLPAVQRWVAVPARTTPAWRQGSPPTPQPLSPCLTVCSLFCPVPRWHLHPPQLCPRLPCLPWGAWAAGSADPPQRCSCGGGPATPGAACCHPGGSAGRRAACPPATATAAACHTATATSSVPQCHCCCRRRCCCCRRRRCFLEPTLQSAPLSLASTLQYAPVPSSTVRAWITAPQDATHPPPTPIS